MKTLLLAIAAACALHASDATHTHIKIRTQHLEREAPAAAPPHERKHVFRVHTRKSLFDHAAQYVATHHGVALDVWSVRAADDASTDPLVDAKVYATPASMKAFARGGMAKMTAAHTHSTHHGHSKSVTVENSNKSNSDWMLDIVEEEKATAALIKADRVEVAACLNRTAGFWKPVEASTVVYTESAFFDCFRPHDDVFAFLDALTAQNSALMTKLPNVSQTFEGRAIPAYRLSTTTTKTTKAKNALYVQSLIHAREWQAGSSTFYTIAKLLDELRRGNARVTTLFESFDWYFVPIVNIDGYIYSGTVDRYWRTNRRVVDADGKPIEGVDLNRNFGPTELFNHKPELVDDETYPGEKPLSEPSTAGVFQFLTSLENLSGVIDMHTFGGDVLRPFSNRPGEAPAPFGPLLKTLADRVSATLSKHAKTPYSSKTGAGLYEAYGCFDDSVFLAYNFTVPSLTIEVEGDDFIVPQSSIRPVGSAIFHGLLRFADETATYRNALEKLDASSSDDDSSSSTDSDSDSDSDEE